MISRWFVFSPLIAVAFSSVLTAPLGAGEETNTQRPNVILITADDLGYGDLSCYGQKNFKTPNLDRLAAEGVRFAQAYAGSTVCAPSRCALMTGLHTGHCRIRGNARVDLRPEDVTIAEMLKLAGYRTAHIGKWGCGMPGGTGEPHKQGFDHWFGYVTNGEAHNYYPDFLWKNGERVDLGNEVSKGVATKKVAYSADLFTADALRFIEENKERPFFLYLGYTQPHANNEAGKNGMEVPDHGEYGDRPWPEPEKGRAAMIAYMDRDIGTLMDKLRGLQLDENTVVIFSSDNGPHKEGGSDPAFHNCNGPLRGIKRDLYEGGIRVPLIVRCPGRVKSAVVSDHICAHWDIMPTIADFAGLSTAASIDGVSLYPTLSTDSPLRQQEQHEFLYWEFHERGFQQAVRTGRWKCVLLKFGGDMELYDLESDTGEEHNVANGHPDVVARVKAYLSTARSENADWPIRPERGAKAKKKS
jgi:arylsulfatase A-like enzyme